jgi:3-hydroxyisobutyrate dehydrogenase-like beta-hydroxyacid dehydrogenase
LSQSQPATVAILGMGVIGSSMAARLAAAGHRVSVWNRSPARLAQAPPEATVAASPAECCRGAAVSLLSLSDDAASLEVALGPGGVIEGTEIGTAVVDTSTTAPATSMRLARAFAEVGVGFVDAPVTGGAEAARRGQLTLLCGGTDSAFEQVLPVLQEVGRRILHLGPSGAGQQVKAVNQVILAGSLLGVAEGVALARAAGLDVPRVIDALRDGAAASWVLSNRAAFMAAQDFPPVGRLALHLKDLKIALESARAAGVALPGAELVTRLEQSLADAGQGDLDISGLVIAVEQSRGAAPTSGSKKGARTGR